MIGETSGNTFYSVGVARGLGEGIKSCIESSTCINPLASTCMLTGGICHLTSSVCFGAAISCSTIASPIAFLCSGLGHGLSWGGKALNATANTLGH